MTSLKEMLHNQKSKLRFNPLTPKSAKYQNSTNIPKFILLNIEKQMVSCKSIAKEVSFEWSTP